MLGYKAKADREQYARDEIRWEKELPLGSTTANQWRAASNMAKPHYLIKRYGMFYGDLRDRIDAYYAQRRAEYDDPYQVLQDLTWKVRESDQDRMVREAVEEAERKGYFRGN